MNATHALGWALVHFLWQGAALAIFLGIALTLTRATAARTRYTLSLLTLSAMLVAPLATGLRLHRSERVMALSVDTNDLLSSDVATQQAIAPESPALPTRAPATSTLDQPVEPASSVARLRGLLTPLLPWLVVAWVAGVVLLSIRLAHGWITARRLRTLGTFPTEQSLQHVLGRLAARMRVTRPVQLLESLLVDVPAVLGWLRPVILVPASALTGLTPQQLEVLLAHELAHVRRYDYLVNVAQCVIETLLFYHPGVWWVSRRVREEREHCCDDIVVQVCGDRRLYASALVNMERLRSATPRLALAATGGALLSRVRRLLLPTPARVEFFPRWAAAAAGVVAVTIVLLATRSDQLTAEPTESPAVAADTVRTAPDTVLRHPDPTQPLAQRWEWARTQARQLGKRNYWIGYQISRPEWLEHSVYFDRGTEVIGQNITISGRLFGDFQGLIFRGVRLAPLTGSSDSDDIAILFGFSSDQSGKVTHVHVASMYLPVDFRGRTLLWLGRGSDAQSLPLIEGLFAATTQPDLRQDIVAAVGIHGTSDAVVPILIRWLNSREPTDVRSQAAEWLGFHPSAAAVVALSRAARSDPARDVRREAAEGLGDNTLPAATDSAIAVARTATDRDARREAVEGLGQKDSDRALAALVTLAQSDPDVDVQREAVETLGEVPGDRGLGPVRDIARRHSRSDVRREAVETLGEHLTPTDAIPTLKAIATSDPSPDVQREAIETLGQLHDGGGSEALAAVTEVARTHPNSDVRRQAIETLGQLAPTAETVRLLSAIARSDHNEDVQRRAVETLGQIEDLGLPAVIDIARTHPNSDVRRQAIETLGQIAPTAETVRLLSTIAGSDPSEDVQRRAVETLGEIGDLGLPAVINIARTHPSTDVRRKAIETIGEHAPPAQALDLLGQIARRDPNPDVQRKAVEALGALRDDRAYRLLVEFARTHPVTDVRRKAIETLGETGRTDSVIAVLSDVARGAEDPDIAREAVETLGELQDARALTAVARIARAPGDIDVRRKAIETYAQAASTDSALALLKGVLAADAPEDVYSRVLEELEGMDGGAGIPALIDAARSHPNREVRAAALRRLAESDDPRAQKVFDQTLRRP
jgi:HEAT repeat protein/beta-lactamase regulating signal transducer with metallopeptidase domain